MPDSDSAPIIVSGRSIERSDQVAIGGPVHEGGIDPAGGETPDEGESANMMQTDASRIRMYEHILDATSDAIFVVSPDGDMTLQYVNESAMRTFRRLENPTLSRDSLIGQPMAFLGYPESITERLRNAVQRASVEKRAVEQYTLTRPNGTSHQFECVMNRVEFDGGVRGVVVVTRDLASHEAADLVRGEILSAEQRAREDAERAVHLRNDFLSTAAHDLKTPLTAAQGRAQLLRRHLERAGGDLSRLDLERMETHIEGVQAAIIQMTHQISELQDVAFLQIGRPLALSLASTDVVTLVAECIDRVSRSEGVRPVVTFTHPDREVVVALDPVRMTRVIDNLLSNAVKYGRPPLAHIDVSISLSPDGDDEEVRVQVADDGIGIPAADLAGVFVRFARASNVGDIHGQGVGLAGARQIARQHGGDLTVASVEGRGSTFTLAIPRGTTADTEERPD